MNTTVKDIKDGDTLAKFLEERDGAITALGTESKGLKDQVAALHKTVEEDAKKADKAFGDLTVLVKGKWRETEPKKVAAEGIARFVRALVRHDYKGAQKLGGEPVRSNSPDGWAKESDFGFGETPDGVEKSDLGTPLRGDSTTGSYVIPLAYANEMLGVAQDASTMMPLVRKVPMSARTIYWPTKGTAPGFSWPTNESTAKTEKSPTFGQVTLTAKTAAGWICLTEEIMEDSLVPLGEYFRDEFGESWGQEFDKQCVQNASAPFQGVLYCADNSATLAGTAFTDAKTGDLRSVIKQLTTKAKRNGARFVMHETVLDHFCSEKDDMGNYIVQKPTEGRPLALLGYPFNTADAMPDITESAADTPFVWFGNPRHILYGERTGFEFRVFDNTEGTMQYDRVYLRCRIRAAFLVSVEAAFATLRTKA